MSEAPFYLTTPIYYVNDKPHIGHAYTTILADVLARYHRSLGEPTFFLTGTDEHGQKVQKAATERGITPQEQCDTTVVRFQELWERLEITNDRFIRTTEPSHKKVVQEVLQDLYDRDLIYKAEYIGHYCIGCERFFTAKDLVDGKCPECNRDVAEILESNYFFRMSRYQDWLIDYIQTHPEFIQPAFRANETLGFLRQPLGDLCISRPKSRLSWGIELPFATDYVCYVWFDALINYISGIGYRQDDELFRKWWPANYHLIGKDILTTHTVYWPTMLQAMNLPLPKTIFAHGWWLTGRDKMSKSLGNVINPMDMIAKCGVDAFRYYLMAEMSPGSDASFTEAGFVSRYNCDLANDLGNLTSRVVKMVLRNAGGVIPRPGELNDDDRELLDAVRAATREMPEAIHAMKIDQGLDSALNAVRAGNRYLEKTAPWTLAKQGNTERLHTVLYCTAETLRRISVLLQPVMPRKMAELRRILGLPEAECETSRIADLADESNVLSGLAMQDSEGLFPRVLIEVEDTPAAAEAPKPAAKTPASQKSEAAPEGVQLINFADFSRVQLKTAKVLEAEKVEGADKLLKLQIDVGGERRQLVAGVALYYTPEQMVGKTIVIVSNLEPAKIRKIESQGMLLAAKVGNELRLITTDGEIASGAGVG